MIRVTGGCALEKMREGARRSRATRNRTYFLIQTLMNPSLAPLRAVRRALDVSVLVIASQSRVTRLRPFRLACSVSTAYTFYLKGEKAKAKEAAKAAEESA